MTGFFVRKKDMETQWKMDWCPWIGTLLLAALSTACLAQYEGDTNGWTEEADGFGGSLEWLGGTWDNALPAGVGSNALGGSPGHDNSTWAD